MNGRVKSLDKEAITEAIARLVSFFQVAKYYFSLL